MKASLSNPKIIIKILVYTYVRFEVFTAVTMKNAVFWDVAQCRSCVNRRFGGDYRDTFCRIIGSHKTYTSPHPRRRHSSLL
jgi:hypothetical protein